MKFFVIIFASVFLLVIVPLGVHWIVQGYLPVPLLLRNMHLLAKGSDDIYNPVVIDNFKFYEEGYTKYFPWKPKYLATYCLEFTLDDSKIASRRETFNGELKLDLYCKNKLLFTKMIGTVRGYGEPSKTYNYYKVYLTDFDIPFDRKSLNNLGIRVTVIKPDKYLEQFTNSIKLCVGVSARL